MYNVPSAAWFDVLYNILSLLTLTSYPFIMSVTPFMEKPGDLAELLGNSRMMNAFVDYLDRVSTSVYLRLY